MSLFITGSVQNPQRKKYRVVVKSMKTNRDGDVLQEPIYATFEDGVFETNNQEVIDFLRNLPNFGADFFEVEKVPETHGYQGHSIGIVKMENDTRSSEVDELKSQVAQLTDLVKSLVVQKQVEDIECVDVGKTADLEETTKIDRRKKEFRDK